MDYLVKIRSVQTPLNGQFSIGANSSLQKEAFFFKKPCIILRNETEWVKLMDNPEKSS